MSDEEKVTTELVDGAPAPEDISAIAGSNFALSTPVAEQNGNRAGPVGYGPAGLKAETPEQESLVVALPTGEIETVAVSADAEEEPTPPPPPSPATSKK